MESNKPPHIEEIVLVDDMGNVYEGTQTNVFAVKDGIIYTANEGMFGCNIIFCNYSLLI